MTSSKPNKKSRIIYTDLDRPLSNYLMPKKATPNMEFGDHIHKLMEELAQLQSQVSHISSLLEKVLANQRTCKESPLSALHTDHSQQSCEKQPDPTPTTGEYQSNPPTNLDEILKSDNPFPELREAYDPPTSLTGRLPSNHEPEIHQIPTRSFPAGPAKTSYLPLPPTPPSNPNTNPKDSSSQ
jgi:hypothetical protein